jgi:hypothetical protein
MALTASPLASFQDSGDGGLVCFLIAAARFADLTVGEACAAPRG